MTDRYVQMEMNLIKITTDMHPSKWVLKQARYSLRFIYFVFCI